MKPHALKRFLLAGGVSCLAFASPAYATLKEALDALKEQDFTFAFEELTRLATEEDNDEARYHLGRMYEEGSGLEKNVSMHAVSFGIPLSVYLKITVL